MIIKHTSMEKNDCRPFAFRMSQNCWCQDTQNKLEKSNETEVMYYKYCSHDKASFGQALKGTKTLYNKDIKKAQRQLKKKKRISLIHNSYAGCSILQPVWRLVFYTRLRGLIVQESVQLSTLKMPTSLSANSNMLFLSDMMMNCAFLVLSLT